MIKTDEAALICDLAETYHVYDYKSLPASLVATLSVGLRDDSRIKMKMSGAKVPLDTLILGMIADRIGNLIWSLSDEAKRGPKPPQFLEMIYGEEIKTAKSDVVTFNSPEDYEKARQKILGKGGE